MNRIRLILHIAALLDLLVVAGFWALNGAHTGWSMNRVPVTMIDEITQIEYITYEERFVPGLDILALGVGFAALIFSLTFLPAFKPKPKS